MEAVIIQKQVAWQKECKEIQIPQVTTKLWRYDCHKHKRKHTRKFLRKFLQSAPKQKKQLHEPRATLKNSCSKKKKGMCSIQSRIWRQQPHKLWTEQRGTSFQKTCKNDW